MQYIVMGSDGKEYGPVGFDELRLWVSENRLSPQTLLRDFNSGSTMAAQTIPGLFAAVAPQFHTPPMTHDVAMPKASKESMGPLWGVIVRSVLAVGVFFLLHGLGLVFGAYALYYAVQCKLDGYRYGWIAIFIALAAVAIVGIGWLLRLSGSGI